VNISGPVYGVSDLRDIIRDVIETYAGRVLYDMWRRGSR
jgi:hypothetical protein